MLARQFALCLLKLRDQSTRGGCLPLQRLHLPGVLQHCRFLLLDLQDADVLAMLQPPQALQGFTSDATLLLPGLDF
ncbi:hypothetical protein D3C81_1367040 [compost metagenome]